MNKLQYSKLLKHPKWMAKRKKILKRDKFSCRRCGVSGVELHVHHKYYVLEKLPWQYPGKALITLCKKCHQLEHKKKPLSKFFKKTKK